MQIHSDSASTPIAPDASKLFRIALQNEEGGALTLHFDGDYVPGQSVGLLVDDEAFIYCVAPQDVCADGFLTQMNVARGMLAALVNGGFTAFPRTQPTLVGNRLTLTPAHVQMAPRIDVVCARNLWCN